MKRKNKKTTAYDNARKYAYEIGRKRFENYRPLIDGVLSPHHYNADSLLISSDLNQMHIGIELEIETSEAEYRKPFQERFINQLAEKEFRNELILVTDASLRFGTELNFAPYTLAEYKARKVKLFHFLKSLAKNGYTSHDSGNCGLHVHFSAQTLTTSQWSIAKKLTNGKFQKLFKTISRRTDFEFCKFHNYDYYDRRQALNLLPAKTREFRFFRGTLKPLSFFNAVDTLIAFVLWVKQNTDHHGEQLKKASLTVKKYLKFFKQEFPITCQPTIDCYNDIQPLRSNSVRLTAEQRAERRRANEERLLNQIAHIEHMALRNRPFSNDSTYTVNLRRPDRIYYHAVQYTPTGFNQVLTKKILSSNRTITIPTLTPTPPSNVRLNWRRGGWGHAGHAYLTFIG